MIASHSLELAGRASAAPANLRALRLWLFGVAALVFAMVLVGGATRLTESGLSITQWKPIAGIVPPLSKADWEAEFALYKRIPQFAEINPDMDLAGFKPLFYWEWAHRFLARLVGLAFVAPALGFYFAGRLRGELGKAVLAATTFLALEPVVGWWMVSSGLVERVEVAQERLALHLLIAAAIFAALLWAGVAAGPSARARQAGAVWSLALSAMLFAQIGAGALVAGLRAGRIYNTWPLMDGRWIPNGLFGDTPFWMSAFDDVTTAQFDHRLLAYGVVALAIGQALATRRRWPETAAARRALGIAALALIQAALGVATLLLGAPILPALAHQALAMALFGAAVAHASLLYRGA